MEKDVQRTLDHLPPKMDTPTHSSAASPCCTSLCRNVTHNALRAQFALQMHQWSEYQNLTPGGIAYLFSKRPGAIDYRPSPIALALVLYSKGYTDLMVRRAVENNVGKDVPCVTSFVVMLARTRAQDPGCRMDWLLSEEAMAFLL